MIKFDDIQPNLVKSTVPLEGRGILYMWTDKDGIFFYRVSDAAKKSLIRKYGVK